MITHGIILYIIGALEIILAFYVLLRNSKSEVCRAYFAFAFGVIIWVLANGSVALFHDSVHLLLLYKLTYFGGAITAGSFLYFTWVFPYKVSYINTIKKVIVVIPGILLGALLFWTDSVVSGFKFLSWGIQVSFGNLYILYVIIFLIYFPWAFIHLYKKYRRSNGMHYWQLKYLLISTSIPFVVSLVTDIFVPWLVHEPGSWTVFLGSETTIIWLGLTAYILFKKEVR
ncbi:MAG: histidine kinase N-terminal 7TM domain-containing protein [Patescibacteria group bacterium]|nr:histidine kinase N-terminal 7TM domain-containing protein [Patescibacteria group bacterium]